MRRTLALIAALSLSLAAFAEETATITREKLDPAAFSQVAQEVRAELTDQGRYSYIKPRDRQKIDQKLGVMERLLEGKSSVNELSMDRKVALYNAQEEINALIEQRKAQRTVCSNRRPTGSNISKTTCETYGEREARRQELINDAQKGMRQPCTGVGCGG